jgi:SAM-dependent methyltransferase
MTDADRSFAGSMPELYDRYLGPAMFAVYADPVAARVAALAPHDVLELAAGTGLLTEALARSLPDAAITATDLNQPMLDHAASVREAVGVTWQQADAQDLPFTGSSFDVVVCQFGAMFFPDRPAAYAEARRVLRPDGTLVLAIWDSLAGNDFARVLTSAVAELMPDNPPRFVERVPHGYHDVKQIRADLEAGGFSAIEIESLRLVGHAASAADVALGFALGTPLRAAVEERDPAGLPAAIDAVAASMREQLGTGGDEITGALSAHIVTVRV